MTLTLERDGRIAVITVRCPERLNAMDAETGALLRSALSTFHHDPELWVAILTAEGDHAFGVGRDPRELLDALHRGDVPQPDLGRDVTDLGTWKPVVAAIEGLCLAGGLELALACDFRVASEAARFGLPQVRWGLLPCDGATQRLPRLLGLAAALDLLLTGREIDASEAFRLGLVHRLVPTGEALAGASDLATTLLQNGPLALCAAKQAAVEGLHLPLKAGLELERELAEAVWQSEDAGEGLRAYADERRPHFRGGKPAG